MNRTTIIFLFAIAALTRCSTRDYSALYTLPKTLTIYEDIKMSKEIINNIASKYSLRADQKYIKTDTLGFFGDPYHYFKFWFITSDTTNGTSIKLSYHGAFGKKGKYNDFLKALGNSLQDKFSNKVTVFVIEDKY